MKNLNRIYFIAVSGLVSMLAACHKDSPAPATPTAQRAGVYVLNQGNYGKSNSSLTYYDYTTTSLTADIFSSANGGTQLGALANDAKVYGSKLYITVDQSGVVNILNAKTAKLIKSVSFLNNTVSREPRSLAFYGSNAFVTLYDGNVAVMDTINYNVSKYIAVGRNPEQMVISNGKLYVVNSGGLTFGNPDKTVSVIDLASLTVTKTITVGDDPYAASVDSYGNIYINAYGNYGVTNASLSIINSSTDVVTSKTDFGPGPFVINGDNAYYLSGSKVLTYNVKTGVNGTTNFITDGTTFTNANALNYDPISGEMFVADALNYSTNGMLYAFDKNGKKEYNLATGIIPGTIVFVNK